MQCCPLKTDKNKKNKADDKENYKAKVFFNCATESLESLRFSKIPMKLERLASSPR